LSQSCNFGQKGVEIINISLSASGDILECNYNFSELEFPKKGKKLLLAGILQNFIAPRLAAELSTQLGK